MGVAASDTVRCAVASWWLFEAPMVIVFLSQLVSAVCHHVLSLIPQGVHIMFRFMHGVHTYILAVYAYVSD